MYLRIKHRKDRSGWGVNCTVSYKCNPNDDFIECGNLWFGWSGFNEWRNVMESIPCPAPFKNIIEFVDCDRTTDVESER